MALQEIEGRGAIAELPAYLQEVGAGSVLLVTGKGSYAQSGAEGQLTRLLAGFSCGRFSDFETNPKVDDVLRGLQALRAGRYEAIVGVGGGSALDMAKLIRIFAEQEGDPVSYIKGEREVVIRGRPLVLAPTTAGSGSEATPFAVVYVDGVKHSVDHKHIEADCSIVDADLTSTLPPSVTACSGMDALCQAVESYWNIRSTPESKTLALQALRLTITDLPDAVLQPDSDVRERMARAAHLAGKAIAITRTTAPHALSYFMTSCFGIPHGHAVGLTLGKVLLHNHGVTGNDCTDPRGAGYVRETVEELA
jgi:alcohol dehydrogenase